ncbi:MAG: ribosome recycling factor [Acidobacteriaceae bacterium]
MAASFMAGIPALKENYQQLKARMEKAVSDFQHSLASARTGRASVHMLDSIRVDYYGSPMALNQLAQVNAPEAQLLTVQPFDPSIIKEIEKALQTSEQGFNPQNDGKLIRIPVPPLTEERRKEMVKFLNKVLEEHRTAVRNMRRDGNEHIKKAMKDKKISEDDERRCLEEIQKMTDDEIGKMEELFRSKEKEVMAV